MSQVEASGATAPAKTSTRPARVTRARVGEWALIAVVVLYAAGLLLAPLVGRVWGSLAEGIGAFAREVTSVDAISSLKLTLIMAGAATVINAVFGICIA